MGFHLGQLNADIEFGKYFAGPIMTGPQFPEVSVPTTGPEYIYRAMIYPDFVMRQIRDGLGVGRHMQWYGVRYIHFRNANDTALGLSGKAFSGVLYFFFIA